MRFYIIRRILLMVPTVFIVSLIVFFMMRLIPGTVVDAMLAMQAKGGSGGRGVDREYVERRLGLDVPLITQYGRWLGVWPQRDGKLRGLLQGDLGRSLWKETPVVKEIARRWPVTLELGLMGLVVAQFISIPIGILSALRQDTWADYIGRSFAILCIAVPGFWLATMVVVFPSIWWGYMPPIILVRFGENPLENLRMFIVPALVLGMSMAGFTMRMTRTMMLEVLRQDYIRTAWSKGLRETVVVARHALKNALIPVVTIIGFQVPVLIGGTVIIEEIFMLPGMGRLVIEATMMRDYPIVSGAMLLFGVAMVLVNLVVDSTYAILDPRIRYK